MDTEGIQANSGWLHPGDISQGGSCFQRVYIFKKKGFKVVLCPNLLPLISISPLNNMSGLTPSKKSL